MIETNNIIVRMPNWIGDIVMALPVLADLRTAYPKASITAMIQAKQVPLLENNPHIDEVFAYEKPNGFLRRKQQFQIINEIRKGQYDLGVLLPNSFSSAWWFWRGQVKFRIGYAANLRSCLLSKTARFAKDKESTHLVITYKRLLHAIGISVSNTKPHIYLTDGEKQQAAVKMGSGFNPMLLPNRPSAHKRDCESQDDRRGQGEDTGPRSMPNRPSARKRDCESQDDRRGQGEDTLVRSEAQGFAIAASAYGGEGGNMGFKIGIHPGAAYGPAKCWPADRYHAVCEKLLENPELTLVFFGDASAREIARTITKGLPAHRLVDLTGETTLRELIASISQCQLFLTGDSGPMHIAAAMGIPIVAIYGSTNEITTGPYGDATILHKHVPCAPCYRRICPIDFRCMLRIDVNEVLQAVLNRVNHGI